MQHSLKQSAELQGMALFFNNAKGYVRSFFVFLLRAYKRWISPLLPPSCRFTPTCSEYAIEAIQKYGVLRGGLLATWRVLRCNPFFRGGYDPVK
jgi:putative membrane protein insertion efficiency factor